jgi:hypothetical protein
MALAGRNEMRVDVKLIAFDTDFTVDNRLAARMVGEAKGDSRFIRHNKFLSR